MNENTASANIINDGKVNVMGIDINISQVLGQKIVDQYIAQLSEEQMQSIIDYVSQDLFTKTSYFNYETNKYDDKIKIKEREKNHWGGYDTKEIPIGELIRNHFNERIKDELKNKVEEIIATTDYKQKVEEIANELIEYSVNGYKEDMKDRIRTRLVGNIINAEPIYCGTSLTDIINNVIDQRMKY